MKSLFAAINHCHANGIVHRDIKPENIMINDQNDVRLIDFGLSKANKKKSMHTVAGTPFYMAPEVLAENYNTKADIWSLGVLLYTLVSGYLPFQGSNNRDVFQRIKNADFHFDHKEFKQVSNECKDLIRKLLVVDTKKRFDGHQALKHNWFKLHSEGKLAGKDQGKVDKEIIDRLKNFKGESLFKRAAMNMLVKMATDKEVEDLRKQFVAIDKDGTGMILA